MLGYEAQGASVAGLYQPVPTQGGRGYIYSKKKTTPDAQSKAKARRICYEKFFSGTCNKPDCGYEHDESILTKFAWQATQKAPNKYKDSPYHHNQQSSLNQMKQRIVCLGLAVALSVVFAALLRDWVDWLD